MDFHKMHTNKEEESYINIMKDIYSNGDERSTRNSMVKSVFGKHLCFDLSKGFPLLTTKRMNLRLIFEELMFFIRGHTDTKILEEKNVNIWKGNTSSDFLKQTGKNTYLQEGEMGPMYGYQWRNFNGENMDQLNCVIELIKKEPTSRRIMMTTYNPLQAEKGVLFPCHGIVVQFYVSNGRLSCHMYQRSADWFLGVPFNIASYALLTHIIAVECNLCVGTLNISFGDCHIYKEHMDACKQQMSREALSFPVLEIKCKKEKIENYEYTDFILYRYIHHDTLKAPMIA